MADSNDYPNTPGFRANAPETSRQAAEAIAPLAASIRAKVLAVVKAAGPVGATGDDIADELGLLVYQVRARLSELRAAGEIVDSERRRKGASGRNGAVWVLPAYGPADPDDGQLDLLARAA